MPYRTCDENITLKSELCVTNSRVYGFEIPAIHLERSDNPELCNAIISPGNHTTGYDTMTLYRDYRALPNGSHDLRVDIEPSPV